MGFKDLSRIREDAEISGKGCTPPPGSRSQHDFVLETFARRVIAPPQPLPEEGVRTVARPKLPQRRRTAWIWIPRLLAHGELLTINGQQFETLDAAPRSFGYLLAQDGRRTPALNHRLASGGIRRLRGIAGRLQARRGRGLWPAGPA
jgi:hypothetical protein